MLWSTNTGKIFPFYSVGVLSISPDDAFDIILSSGFGDSVKDHNSPIVERAILREFRQIFRCKFREAELPKLHAPVVENKDVEHTPTRLVIIVKWVPVIKCGAVIYAGAFTQL